MLRIGKTYRSKDKTVTVSKRFTGELNTQSLTKAERQLQQLALKAYLKGLHTFTYKKHTFKVPLELAPIEPNKHQLSRLTRLNQIIEVEMIAKPTLTEQAKTDESAILSVQADTKEEVKTDIQPTTEKQD